MKGAQKITKPWQLTLCSTYLTILDTFKSFFRLTKENHISILLSTEKWNGQHILSILQMFSQLRSSFFKANTLEVVNLMEALYENE